MHRHLFQVYPDTEENSFLIHKATRLFRSLLQGADGNNVSLTVSQFAENVSSTDSSFIDVIAEYLIDTKLYTRSDYQPERAKNILLSHTSLLSSSMERYLLETIRPELIQSKIDAKTLFQKSVDECKQKYNEDLDYPIYVRSLSVKEKYEKTLSQLSQEEKVVEWLIKTKSSSSSRD